MYKVGDKVRVTIDIDKYLKEGLTEEEILESGWYKCDNKIAIITEVIEINSLLRYRIDIDEDHCVWTEDEFLPASRLSDFLKNNCGKNIGERIDT